MSDHPQAAELLEEMLRQGEAEFFPKFTRHFLRFIDTFNHGKIQDKVRQYFDEVDEKLAAIQAAQSVFDMISTFRDFLRFVELEFGPVRLFKRFQESGFFALVNDKRFDFFDTEITIEESADRLLSLTDEGLREELPVNLNQAFEEYVQTWSENRREMARRNGPDIAGVEATITNEISKMRAEKAEVERVTKDEVKRIIDDVLEYFEPMRKTLLNYSYARPAVVGADGLQLAGGFAVGAGVTLLRATVISITAITAYCMDWSHLYPGRRFNEWWPEPNVMQAARIRLEAARIRKRRLEGGWYDTVVKFITSFLRETKTEDELRSFLLDENLEDDVQKFRHCVDQWLRKIRTGTSHHNSLLISKEVAMADIERMKEFVYAVILNQPSRIDRHNQLVETLLNTAVNEPATGDQSLRSYLPFVSFGQLPLPTSGKRIVRFTFVVGTNQASATSIADSILTELRQLFKGIKEHSQETRNGNLLLHLDVAIEDNLPVFLAQNVSRLSSLSIRAVLVGSFGLDGFRHAMKPEFNRIYGTESAEGFINTRFTRPLMHGGEPYFCPTGWRRYSINVGLNREEFKHSYGDWPVAYHGSSGHLANTILHEGLQASGNGAFLSDGEGRIYVSPSIEYSGHPRYARVWKIGNRYVQMVLQLRIEKRLIFFKKPGTLPGAHSWESALDPNFVDNRELEWIIRWPPGRCIDALNGIVVYGLMLRVTAEHPDHLPQCAWWRETR